MQIQLNGDTYTLDDQPSIADLIAELDRDTDGLAVAVNDDVVPKTEWDDHILEPGDLVEVIQAVQGG